MAAIITDIDGTVVSEGGTPNDALINVLNDKHASGDEIIVVSARPVDRLDETRQELREAGLHYSSIHLNDFPGAPIATGLPFKTYKAKKLLADGHLVKDAIDNSAAVRRAYDELGINAWSPSEYVAANRSLSTNSEERAIDPAGYLPTGAMKAEADQALEWRREFNRGGTLVGVARARDISSGKRLPYDTVRRMSSYFSRHAVDKEATGFRRGEDGFPSAGRIAWGLWGGDAGAAWAMRIIREADSTRAAHSVEVDMGIEFRTAKVELRAVDETGMEFEGYAALFDSPSAEGTIPEVVKDTAFNRSLAAVDRGEWDVRAYQDHDPKLLLGTTKSGTLSLQKDNKGLKAKIRLNPEVSFHRDLAAIVKSMGSSLGMSFGFFSTSGNRINEDGVRELKDVKLVEVSALTGLAPYYPGTVSLVSVRGLAAKAGVDSSELRDAVAALLAGEATQDHASILASAIAASSRDVEGVPTTFPGDEPKKDEPKKEEEPIVKDENTKVERSLAEDAGIDPVALQAATDALAAGSADDAQIALLVSAAKAIIAEDAADAQDAPTDPNLPVDPNAPAPEGDQGMGGEGDGSATKVSVEVEVEIPRSVPRSTLALALDLEGRRVV